MADEVGGATGMPLCSAMSVPSSMWHWTVPHSSEADGARSEEAVESDESDEDESDEDEGEWAADAVALVSSEIDESDESVDAGAPCWTGGAR